MSAAKNMIRKMAADVSSPVSLWLGAANAVQQLTNHERDDHRPTFQEVSMVTIGERENEFFWNVFPSQWWALARARAVEQLMRHKKKMASSALPPCPFTP